MVRRDLLLWQWSLYEQGHRDRNNLILHALTAPLFIVGTVLGLSAVVRPVLALIGAVMMVSALVLQGSGHKRESTTPVPFLGPGDFVSRFLVEQWVTFPRFVLSGSYGRAWRNTAR